MKRKTLLLSIALSASAFSADYKIDIEGMHASVLFKISHLGISWLRGGFDKFQGNFSYDADKPNNSKITMTVDTGSINSNHAERDSHIRADDLLNTEKFPKATFTSESFNWSDANTGTVVGKFTLHGVEKTVSMAIKKTGEGKDPWGGYRVGFEGVMTIKLADYGIKKNLGKTSETLELFVDIEGIRQ
ncbi:MAG: YceI family protein [Proteobacteria bacterium]|nr:YceI family protein [Pseudomonadota bacterium]